MKLSVLGCDGSYPAANGACSGYLVDCGAQGSVLLDCGSGVLSRLMARMDPSKLRAIVLTHWHNDHASDLLVLRYYLQIHKRSLPLYAPVSDQHLRLLAVGKEFVLHDISEGFSLDGLQMRAMPVTHPVPAYAVKLSHGAKCLVYTGDIAMGLDIADFCLGADMLVCDASFTQEQWNEKMPHLSAYLAGDLAARSGVGQLLLTHCQPNSDVATLLREGRERYSAAQFAAAGAEYTI